ncbi:MAG TPA: sulfotransferase [Rhizomicrobium sp.]|jgi:tetratricopeptide (TPR) repeat protein
MSECAQTDEAAPQNAPAARSLEERFPVAARLTREGRKARADGDMTLAELRATQALQRVSDYPDALLLLWECRRRSDASSPEYEELLRAVIRQHPSLLDAITELSLLLFSRGERVECEIYARRALRMAPMLPRAHGIMGLIFTETNRAAAGEFHFRRVIELEGEHTRVATNLANCLKMQGKTEESEHWFRRATELAPQNVDAWIGWSRLEEARRNFPHAWELLRKAEEITGGAADLGLARAVLFGREKKDAEAVEALSSCETEERRLTAIARLERGRLYDKMDRFDEAWADFEEGKRLCREVQGRRYNAEAANDLVARLKGFFTRGRTALIPRADTDGRFPQPIFIVGFPRSGTTMVEQTITAHPEISAGDELVFVSHITHIAQRWLASPRAYPECLADLWMGDNQLVLNQFRDYYLSRAGQLGIWEQGARFFTDKMPLNETHLGLIHLMFPQSPIVYMRRHPLDILISNFSNFLTHGFQQAFDLKTSASHYVLIDGLVEHYRRELDLKFLEVRYEDLIADQEKHVREILAFIGVAFDPRCLSFENNQRYARTASYAQVTEKLYGSSVHRYRHYRKHLDEAVAILKPTLDRLGYSAD